MTLRSTQSLNDLNKINSIKEIKYLHYKYNELKRKYPLSYYYLFQNISYKKEQRISHIKDFYNEKRKIDS